MKLVKITQTTELSEGNKKKISLEDKEILLVNIENTYYAIDNKCPHMGGSLYDGTLEGSNVVCPRHGSIFDVKTGKNIQGAKIAFVKIKVNDVQSYPVKVEGNDILIEME